MPAITPTLVASYNASSGRKKVKLFTIAPGSASDTVALSSYFSSIDLAIPVLTAGNDAALQSISATTSGTTVTVVTYAAAGTAATDWTGAAGALVVFGETVGV